MPPIYSKFQEALVKIGSQMAKMPPPQIKCMGTFLTVIVEKKGDLEPTHTMMLAKRPGKRLRAHGPIRQGIHSYLKQCETLLLN